MQTLENFTGRRPPRAPLFRCDVSRAHSRARASALIGRRPSQAPRFWRDVSQARSQAPASAFTGRRLLRAPWFRRDVSRMHSRARASAIIGRRPSQAPLLWRDVVEHMRRGTTGIAEPVRNIAQRRRRVLQLGACCRLHQKRSGLKRSYRAKHCARWLHEQLLELHSALAA